MADLASNFFSTGPTTLPDVGEITYNGVDFSPLFTSQISGNCVKDEATRTTKYMEYTLSVDGYVTVNADDDDIAKSMQELATALTAQGGELIYKGRGFDLIVNPPNNVIAPGAVIVGRQDVVWGPVPELLEFQPLGGGNSAKIKWQCKVRVTEISKGKGFTTREGLTVNLLQFNYETSVIYGEDGYSAMSVRGTAEIPMTRPTQKDRNLTLTADNLRNQIDLRIMKGIDLERFRVVNRTFNVSRDKRILEWDIRIEEKPYMDLPPACTIARGTEDVRPAKAGMGLCLWLCTLRVTYTVAKGTQRRVAWLFFLDLLRERMKASRFSLVPNFKQPAKDNDNLGRQAARAGLGALLNLGALDVAKKIAAEQEKELADIKKRTVWLIDFNISEGIYLDSKSITFSATWRLTTTFSHILLASGIWRKLPEYNFNRENIWASSMKDIMGSKSWLTNKIDPKLDVIIDFGS